MVRRAYSLRVTLAVAIAIGTAAGLDGSINPAHAQEPKTAITVTPQTIGALTQTYYKNPSPAMVPHLVRAMAHFGFFDNKPQRLVALGFVAGAIATDGGLVETLAPVFQQMNGDQSIRLVRAVQLSGRADWKMHIEKLKARWPNRAAQIEAMTNSGARAVYQLNVEARPDLLDMNWAYFGATGRRESVDVIIGALRDIGDTTDPMKAVSAYSAKWSLAAQASHHGNVMTWCREALNGPHAAEMKTIIAAVENKNVGAIKGEATDAMRKFAGRTAAAPPSDKQASGFDDL